ncbi:hypothetical protein [Alkalihalobacterium chitinilyticum]|uniref:DUF4352 domain-containing protein n=1 Tax=Alkalihalobacterium chitinilyticum TaxID=2980103 RepID=A0ABT5VIK8_9BACI|nr:hypothetical protein [Alkalihalobacterium chitinilyticum]MDE5414283.1 hypothetical protein [Alkalihalobacterium chitinilyticum]
MKKKSSGVGKKVQSKRLQRNMVVCIASLAILSACSNSTSQEDVTVTDNETLVEQEVIADEEPSNIEPTNEESHNEDKEMEEKKDTVKSELPKTIEVDQQLIHNNGTVLTIESVHLGEEFITIDIQAINGASNNVFLSWGGKNSMILQDDTGVTYPFLPPERNHNLEIKIGERLSGSLIFVGRINGEATSLHLKTNPNGSEDKDATDMPSFFFEYEDL